MPEPILGAGKKIVRTKRVRHRSIDHSLRIYQVPPHRLRSAFRTQHVVRTTVVQVDDVSGVKHAPEGAFYGLDKWLQ